MKKSKGVWFFAALVMVGIALAAFASTDVYFRATGNIETTNTALGDPQVLDFTEFTDIGKNSIDMTTGADSIVLGVGDDVIQFGKGSDMLRFAGGSGDQDPVVEKITFSTDDETKIQHTRVTDELLIKSNTGDVVIQIGN